MLSRVFNGSSDYARIAAPLTAPPFTVSLWFTVASLTPDYVLWSLQDSALNDIECFQLLAKGITAGDPIRFRCANTANTTFVNADSDSGYLLNTWTHALGVAAATNSRSAGINGVLGGTPNTASRTLAGINRMSLGVADDATPNHFLNGQIAHVAVYNVADLSAAELLLLASISPLHVRPSALVRYWPDISRPCVISGLSYTLNGTTAGTSEPAVTMPRRSNRIIVPARPPVVGGTLISTGPKVIATQAVGAPVKGAEFRTFHPFPEGHAGNQDAGLLPIARADYTDCNAVANSKPPGTQVYRPADSARSWAIRICDWIELYNQAGTAGAGKAAVFMQSLGQRTTSTPLFENVEDIVAGGSVTYDNGIDCVFSAKGVARVYPIALARAQALRAELTLRGLADPAVFLFDTEDRNAYPTMLGGSGVDDGWFNWCTTNDVRYANEVLCKVGGVDKTLSGCYAIQGNPAFTPTVAANGSDTNRSFSALMSAVLDAGNEATFNAAIAAAFRTEFPDVPWANYGFFLAGADGHLFKNSSVGFVQYKHFHDPRLERGYMPMFPPDPRAYPDGYGGDADLGGITVPDGADTAEFHALFVAISKWNIDALVAHMDAGGTVRDTHLLLPYPGWAVTYGAKSMIVGRADCAAIGRHGIARGFRRWVWFTNPSGMTTEMWDDLRSVSNELVSYAGSLDRKDADDRGGRDRSGGRSREDVPDRDAIVIVGGRRRRSRSRSR